MSEPRAYIAYFRWHNPAYGFINPAETTIPISAHSLAEARRIAKGMEGREDDMTWFNRLTGEVRS